MKELFKKFGKTGILVIGDLMIDQYVWGKVKRISPEAPVPVVDVTEEELLLGGAANVAHNVSTLGGRVFIAGTIGKDESGRILINKLEEKGFNTDGVIRDGKRPTTIKTRVIAHSQQVVRFDREEKTEIQQSILSLLLDYVRSCLPQIKGIVISDYCKGLITKKLVKSLLELAGSKIFISVDPKIGHFDYYRGVDLITPNTNEASFAAGIDISDDKTLMSAGNHLIKKLQCGSVIITRGDEGMTLFERSGRITHIPTCAQEVYDVSGAGDTVIATLTLCKAAGAPLTDAAIVANHAAGVVVGKIGTATVTQQDIVKSMKMCKPNNLKKIKL
jgi:rfaE bifunctional protein kinase chain/domain